MEPRFGPEWSSQRVAQLRYDAKAAVWTLYCSDRNGRWWRYEPLPPKRDVAALLAEIHRDPTGIFWG